MHVKYVVFDIPSVWRLNPRLEVAHEAGFAVLDRPLTPDCLIEGFLCMPCAHEVVELCP